MGDMVACPRCKGVFPISQGDPTLIVYGAPAAYHGCRVACGAILLSRQMVTTTDSGTDSGGGAGAGANDGGGMSAVAQGFGSIGNGLAASYENQPADDQAERFLGRFQLIDQTTGAPSIGHSVRSTGGQYLTGTTDGEGYTQWVERDAAEALAFDIIGQGKA